MTLQKITNKQTEILNLIHKYRFLNRIQIQTFLNHKNKKNINTWLKDLNDKQYLNRIYSDSIVTNFKPAIYYAGINAIRYFKSLDQNNSSRLKNLYRDNERSQSFIDDQIFIADIGLHLLEVNKKEESSEGKFHYEFVTAADVTSNPKYEFMDDLSPQLIFTKKSKSQLKQYILVLLDSMGPKYMVKKKMKNYIEFFFTNDWEENIAQPFPTILFGCQTLSLLIYAKRSIKGLLDDYQNPDELNIWFATNEVIAKNGITAGIWEKLS